MGEKGSKGKHVKKDLKGEVEGNFDFISCFSPAQNAKIKWHVKQRRDTIRDC